MGLDDEEPSSCQELQAKERVKGEEKLGGLACVKESSRDVFNYKVTAQREEFFEDHI